MKIIGLLLAKKESSRLKNKNWRQYKGKPMFQWNLEKCLMVFDEVYVSSDCKSILMVAEQLGAFGLTRPPELLEVANIPCYQHLIKHTDADAFVAVQVNSPELSIRKIKWAKDLLELGHSEIKSCHEDKSDYGSIWAMTRERLKDCKDDYVATPSFWITDKSIDIHTIEDLYKQYDESKQYKRQFDNRRNWTQPQREYTPRQNYDRRGESNWGRNS